MTNERLEDSHVEGHKHRRLKKTTKIAGKALLALLVAAGVTVGTCVIDANIHKKKKDADKELYGEFKVAGKDAIVLSPNFDGGPDPLGDSIKISLDTIMEHNRDMISIDATKLESIMLGEEALKTNKKFLGIFNLKGLDSWLEEHGITRDLNSESLIRKTVGKKKKGSYGPYQVQLDAINKYKENPELYDELCKKIAKLRLPDTEGKFISLHEQLGLSVEEMVKHIKNNTLYAFSGGGRFLAAYGIVLIDQISRESESIIDSYDGVAGYSRWESNTKEAEKNHTELAGHQSNDNIMSPYFLLNKGTVSYNEIGNLFNNDVFRNGMVSAYRCMDYINNIKNSDYLFILSLLELNERFESGGKGELDIITPTGNFGKSTRELVNKHFNKNFENNDEAKKFMESLSLEELKGKKDAAFDKFEQNMRLLYILNSENKNGINQIQSKYLAECLDITFNHMYAGVNIFSKFIDKNCGDSSIINNKLYEYWDSYISNQDKKALEKIKNIMTDEEAFLSFTGLSKKSYLLWIKFYLCPTLLGSTDRVYQTGGIIPVIQDHEGGEGKILEEGIVNESNSIYRLHLGVSQEQIAQADRERGVEYTLKLGETNIDSLKNIMWSKKTVKEYLQKCKTIDGDSITSPQDIPDELVSVMLRGYDGFYPLFEDGERFYEGDTIYIKYIGLEDVYHKVDIIQPATKEIEEKRVVTKKVKTQGKKKGKAQGRKKGKANKGGYEYIKVTETIKKNVNLCTVNENGTLTMGKGGTFQEVLYFYSQNDPQMKKILEIIAGKPILQQSDIDQNIIKKIIRHADGCARININTVSYGDKFIITIPLNY